MGYVGKGKIVSEERALPCGGKQTWHAITFVDDTDGCEKVVGRFANREHAQLVKERYEKLTCFVPATSYSRQPQMPGQDRQDRDKTRGKRTSGRFGSSKKEDALCRSPEATAEKTSARTSPS